ncbi:uncharacterized protein LOC112905329 [Agrilus planipennis]|uniref:Uncharacterized protein LOC112905329 n=1 Tax=Agrilus planipennis TaxID=224129 RepID=A0A7F5RBF2_AGRPL|nr:uncharacterized protein LOC112905329 [Agrilus planipennis]
MTTESLKSLTKQRGVAKGQITRLQTFLNSQENFTLSVLEFRKLKLEEYYNNWCDLQSQIECLDDNVEYDKDREEIENVYYVCADLISNQIEKLSLNNGSSSSETFQTTSHNVSQTILPKINIKQFNGDFLEWHGFHDTFKSLVHDSNAISAIHKFHLLKSYLIGDASAVIESLNASEENYLVAWNLLQKRFNNPRKIIHSHLQALFELPEVTKDSAIALRSLAERAEMHINALKALNQPVDWHEMLIYIISAKLDKQSRIMWERSLEDNVMPTFSDFVSFLNKISRDSQPVPLFKNINNASKFNQLHQKRASFQQNKRDTHSYTFQSNLKCSICSQGHFIHNCDNFLKLTPQQRLEAAKNSQLCINCLKSSHKTSLCKSSSCKKCHGRHNTLLHFDKNTRQNDISSIQPNISNEPATSAFTTIQCNEILLSTARIIVLDKQNKEHECRVLLDGGSQSNFMTERLANTLNLQKQQIYLPASGLGQSQQIIRYSVKTTIKNKNNTFAEQQTFFVLPTITAKLPSRVVNRNSLDLPKNLRLADPEFHKPADIDMLLGEYIFFKLLCVGQIRLANDTTVLQKTRLGWLVSGKVNTNHSNSIHCHSALTLETQLEKFWKLEDCTATKHLSKEEIACETHFQNSLSRDDSGRYVVRLPFNANQNKLGNTYNSALKRFYSLEKRLTHNSNLRHEYCEFMNEYISLGHMSNITHSANKNSGYYLPHHAVVKETSTTTKVRVVFDGSLKSDTGLSLNDTLMVGPTIQDDVFSLIVRFRTHKYVLTADIEKMFRQINVHENDTNYQKILWRNSPDEPVQTFKLNTVTYGTASAPFLAVRCLKQLAVDESTKFPSASLVLANDCYVDDLLTGTSTLEDASSGREGKPVSIRICMFLTNQGWSKAERRIRMYVPCKGFRRWGKAQPQTGIA